MADQMARMGEWVIAGGRGSAPDDRLTCIGLGSCIGLALVDRSTAIAALSHVMLPAAPGGQTASAQPGKFADQAVDALLEALVARGARKHRLEAVLVGGAQMFALGSGSGRDIGARNEQVVREQLAKVRIPVRAAATGGARGRSMVVLPVAGEVTAREAGGQNEVLLAASPSLSLSLSAA